jgi:hypothetical protein
MIALVPALLATLLAGPAVAAPWSQLPAKLEAPQLPDAELSAAQLKSIAALLRAPGALGDWDCAPEEMDALVHGSRFQSVPLASPGTFVVAQAPAGCARGGQGSNGAMWLLRLDGDSPSLLATPGDGLDGCAAVLTTDPGTGHTTLLAVATAAPTTTPTTTPPSSSAKAPAAYFASVDDAGTVGLRVGLHPVRDGVVASLLVDGGTVQTAR